MNKEFSQGGYGSTGKATNRQSVANDWGVPVSQVVEFATGAVLTGKSVIIQGSNVFPLPVITGTAVSLTNGILVSSTGSDDLGDIAARVGKYVPVQKTFASGFTIEFHNQVVAHAGGLWRWTGALPNVVAPGSTPSGSEWVDVSFNSVSKEVTALRNDLKSPDGEANIGHEGMTLKEFNKVKSVTELIAIKLQDNVQVKFDLYGDSTFWGAWTDNLNLQSPQEPGLSFKRALGIIYANTTADVRNKAISGTALYRMLAGTDGGVGTFAERIAASDADVVFINHAMNDMQDNTSLAEYEKNVVKAIEIVRNAGKLLIWATPNAVTWGSFDRPQLDKPVRIEWFADVVRKVCAQYDIPVVDNNYFTKRTLEFMPASAVVPDGVHPSDLLYEQIGFNLALPFVKCNRLVNPKDAQPAFGCDVRVTPTKEVVPAWPSSKFGQMVTASGPTNSLKQITIPFIYDSGHDVDILVPAVVNGAASVSCVYLSSYDQVIQHSQLSPINAHLASNQFTVLPGGSIPCGLATITIYVNNVSQNVSLEGVMLSERVSHSYAIQESEGNTQSIAYDLKVNTQRFTSNIAFQGLIGKSCGLKVMGLRINGTTDYQHQAYVGLNSDGKAVIGVWNSTSNTFDVTVVGNDDLSLGMHTYGVAITNGLGGSIYLFVDGVRLGGKPIGNSMQGGNLAAFSSGTNRISLYNLTVINKP